MSQLPLWSGTPTAAPSSGNEPPKDGSQGCKCSRETFGCSLHPTGRAEWIASMQVSLALRLASLENERERWTNEICGLQPHESLGKFNPDGSFSKTSADLFPADTGGPSCPTFPASGILQNGRVWELTRLAPRTGESGGGAWPTPDACMNRGTQAKWKPKRDSGQPATYTLNQAVRDKMWPTPTVCGNYNRKGASPTSGDGLATAVLKVATPTARNWRSGKASQATHDKNSRPLSEQIGGSLNPTWVEWLMGWPLGWTVSKG